MDRKTYFAVSGFIFAAIAVLHALRLFLGWEAMIGGWEVPVWVSWAALVVGGFLAWRAWQLKS